MSNYPKLPSGPSPHGAAGSRALDAAGGNWQRRFGADYTAKLMGDFRRVEPVGLPEYATSGRVSPSKGLNTATYRYQQPYTTKTLSILATALGGIEYAGGITARAVTRVTTNYVIRAGSTEVYREDVATFTNSWLFYNYYNPRGIATDFVAVERNQVVGFNGQDGGFVLMTGFANIFVGGFPQPDGRISRRGAAAFFTQTDGRQDNVGRPLPTPAIVMRDKTGADDTYSELLLTPSLFTRHDAEFFNVGAKMIAVKSATMLILTEKFFFPGPISLQTNYQPKMWAIVARGHDLGNVSAADITNIALSGVLRPVTSQLSEPPLEYFGVGAGSLYNARMSETTGFLLLVALPNNRVLMFFRVTMDDAPDYTWRQRIVAFDLTSTTARQRIYDQAIEASGVIQHAVHLGENKVLAKRVLGFLGINYTVEFMKSNDGGVTWLAFAPTGFDAPLLNQYFGNFTVHSAEDTAKGKQAVVLVNSWDPATGTYHTYASADGGYSWARRGKIAKPTQFYRIDSFVSGDGGGNFEQLTRGPTLTDEPVDVTIPDRYVHD